MRDDLHVLALGDQRVDPLARGADDRRCEAAGQAAVGGGDDHQVTLSLAPVPASSFGAPSPGHAGGQVGDDGGHALGVGPGVLGRVLAAAQLGRGHHLHRFRDLLRGLHACDPIAHFLEASHPRSQTFLNSHQVLSSITVVLRQKNP